MDKLKLDRREFLFTSQSGGYCSSTLELINRRKYHSMLVYNLENETSDNISIVATVDETIHSSEGSFELGNHHYPNVLHPKGFSHLSSAQAGRLVYQTPVGELTKELRLSKNGVLFIRYSAGDLKSPITLEIMPLFNYRSIHTLSHKNDQVDSSIEYLGSGIELAMYAQMPRLKIECSSPAEFYHRPDWYLNVEYPLEQQRGYDFSEDLFSYGSFEKQLSSGDSFVMSYRIGSQSGGDTAKSFERAKSCLNNSGSLTGRLLKSAESFVVCQSGRNKIVAGYPWFGAWGRDTFIALPGLLLSTKPDPKRAIQVIDSMIEDLREGLFVNMGSAYNSVDAPMWFFTAIQALEGVIGRKDVAHKYYETSKRIIESLAQGANGGITMHDNGLLNAKVLGKALTWCDAIVAGEPVTARYGYSVEVCALWYNAVRYTLDMAKSQSDTDFISKYKALPKLIKSSFQSLFWDRARGYLADSIDGDIADWSIRSNQIVAAAIPYSPLSTPQRKSVMTLVQEHLLTPCGLRTLSSIDPNYKPRCVGTQAQRDSAYHCGTVWVWQLEYYVRCGFELYGREFLPSAKKILAEFEQQIDVFCIGSIAEIFDGEQAHTPRGAISQAWSVGALLAIKKMIQDNK